MVHIVEEFEAAERGGAAILRDGVGLARNYLDVSFDQD